MDLDLDTLKSDILHYLEGSEFAVFRGHPGALEEFPMITWDDERYPDYQMFLDAARKTGASMIVFASREFEAEEVDDSIEELEECELTRDERRDFERQLRAYRSREGVTCSLELAFDHHSRMYVYQVNPDWYNDFLAVCDEISAHHPDDGDDEEEKDSFGGFYSSN
ncbi:MAG: hypothetical protein M3Y07_05305 [Acidobacteriota bacterium]|nr:hypothetical protein [Acidobacteriota bacterium]